MNNSVRKVISTRDGLDRVMEFLQGLPLPIELEIHSGKKYRTRQQNNLYRRWVGIIADYVGENHEAMHQILGHMFLPKKTVVIMGKNVELPLSTREMTVSQMMVYMDHIEVLAAEYGIRLERNDLQEQETDAECEGQILHGEFPRGLCGWDGDDGLGAF